MTTADRRSPRHAAESSPRPAAGGAPLPESDSAPRPESGNAPPRNRPTVLVTGFEPFGGDEHNPSGDIARRLGELGHPDAALVSEVLPVSFTQAPALLAAAIDRHEPDIVLMLGLAADRHAITPERVALNLADARIPDNDGMQPVDAPLQPHGPTARFALLPVKSIANAIDASGIPSTVSLSAGTYVCNALMYTALGIAEQRVDTGGQPLGAGFIHVPATPQLGGDPRFTLDELERGMRIAITTIVDHRA